MRFGIAALMFFVLGTALSTAGQSKKITNADLEKYRQAHLSAQRDYLENYERLGMPSPAELDRRRELSRVEMERLSDKLRAQEIERERLDILRSQSNRVDSRIQTVVDRRPYAPVYFASYGLYYGTQIGPRQYRKLEHIRSYGYVGGGRFWPIGSGTRTQPLIRVQRR